MSVTFDLPGGEKIVLKYCPGGKFTMGSPAGEKGRHDNEAKVEVELSSHYWMAETEMVSDLVRRPPPRSFQVKVTSPVRSSAGLPPTGSIGYKSG